jgi:ASC-1-like (ASCH) protein
MKEEAMGATTETVVWVKKEVLPLFSQGKDLEVRLGSPLTEWVEAGDIIVFNETLRRRVAAIRRYIGVDRMLEGEGFNPSRIYPGRTIPDIKAALIEIYGSRALNREMVVWELVEP